MRLVEYVRNKLEDRRYWRIYRGTTEEIAAWQFKRARAILEHAKRHVPAYAALLSDVNTSTLSSLKDWEGIPIVNKKFYRAHPANNYLDGSRVLQASWKKTSGTSGSPFSLMMSSSLSNPRGRSFRLFRFLIPHGKSIENLVDMRIIEIDIRAPRYPGQLFLTIEETLSDTEAALARISAHQSQLIASYPSILLRLAEAAAKKPGILRNRIPFGTSYGEKLTPATRAYIEKHLCEEIFERYGSGEMGAVALECDEHNGMHENSESVMAEVVDAGGKSVPLGTSGRLILTDLTNYNMPFIRYEIGDSGCILPGSCSCGLQTPRIKLDGRYTASLSIGDREVHHLEFDGALDGQMHRILQFQVAKTSDKSIEVRLVPGSAFDDATMEYVRESMQKLVGSQTHVDIHLVEEIPLTERGKSRILIDETTRA